MSRLFMMRYANDLTFDEWKATLASEIMKSRRVYIGPKLQYENICLK